MLYIASVRHKAAQCPGNDPDLMREAAEKLSKANLLKKNIEIVDAFIAEILNRIHNVINKNA